MLSLMAALELAHYRIRVNIICPGAIDTNIGENTWKEKEKLKKVQIPIDYPEGNQPLEDRPGTPEQVADLVLFLASSQTSHITGSEIYIDGAQSHVSFKKSIVIRMNICKYICQDTCK